jgi:type III restriction enzyme
VKLLLKDFQSERVAELVRRLRQAARSVREGDLEAVSLSSPTGSGKTVMATRAIELLFEGDDKAAPQPDATFLWITDQPELNEQTRRKMLDASSELGPSDLVVIDSSFDQETFTPGKVYFLNTQKLGKNSLLVTAGDKRTYTLWETITNTVVQRPSRFYVFIDEAHRGMEENPRARNEATTIIQKFIKGSPGEIPPVPLIVGISATPERFNNLLLGQTPSRRYTPVAVDPEEVRASGLLKERITLFHPTEEQPSDITMLRAAALSWQSFVREWSDYCEAQGVPPVRPVLVVQVQDGTGKQLSRTDIDAALRTIDDAVGPLSADAFAHAFQEGTRLEIDGRELRYLPPADIDRDPNVQVVFFKTSLNTGWDCPRAEVMMSFRTAVDATLIAQLVGRMVRTPLARRIDSDEHLNSVTLYLPHYDAGGLNNVVSRLTTPDPDILPPVEIEKGEEALTLRRADFMEDAFAVLERLPSYVIPRARKTSEVRRLMKLGRLLAGDGIDPDGPENATDILLGVLRAEYDRLKETDQFKTIVEEKGKLDVRAVNWQLHGELDEDAELIQLDIAAENVEDLFEAAGRKIGEGLHKAWWKARVQEDSALKTAAKLELFALCMDSAVLRKVETTAQQTVQKWLKNYQAAIAGLNEGRRQAYDEIRRLAAEPEQAPLSYPDAIDGKKAEKAWKSHLYVDGYGLFHARFNRWETKVLEEELARTDVVAWLRNPDRKSWSLCIPYHFGGEWQPLYPDFLIIRKTPGGLVADLLDPHSIDLADAPAKAAGLAQYAAKHAHEFGRIELIIVDGDEIKRLDLTDEQCRDRVKGVSTREHLRQLFALGS